MKVLWASFVFSYIIPFSGLLFNSRATLALSAASFNFYIINAGCLLSCKWLLSFFRRYIFCLKAKLYLLLNALYRARWLRPFSLRILHLTIMPALLKQLSACLRYLLPKHQLNIVTSSFFLYIELEHFKYKNKTSLFFFKLQQLNIVTSLLKL